VLFKPSSSSRPLDVVSFRSHRQGLQIDADRVARTEVGGVPEVVAALGVADTTVRTHVGRLFEKTGATRQADLVKLVAGYAAPLEG
jgi:hypothetical protein